jgi:hypothetical protein
MKADIAIEEIGAILVQLDIQEDLDEVVTYMTNFQGGGESAMSLEELKESVSGPRVEDPRLWDLDGPEDGGHPY